jgi:hypothetical protein
MKNTNPYTDTTTRKYQNSNYEKTKEGWVKKVEQTEAAAAQVSPADTKKEYTDEELAEYAKKASDEALRKAGSGRDERMRIAAKKEILRRKNEGMPEPEKSDNPFDEGMEKGLFDEFPTKVFGGKEYINKGKGWEVLEKARAAVGEIRTWSGEKYQKTATGWKYLGKVDGGAKPAAEKKEEKSYDKPWPESLDKLTNRAEYRTIREEAEKAAENKFDEQYPDPEVFYKERADHYEKYSWSSDKFPKDGTDEEKAQWKKEQKDRWVTVEASEIMGSRRGEPSKTSMIANIKSYWKGVQEKKDKAKADADYKALIESNEGAAGRKAFGEALKANAQEFITKKNEIKAQLLDTIKSQFATGVFTDAEMDKMKIRLSGDGKMSISGLSSRWEDVEVYYRKRWGDEGRKYEVQTTSYGSIEPGSAEAKIVLLQAQCLSNPQIIEAIKGAIEKVDEAKNVMQVQIKELEAKYSDYRESEVWDEYVADIDDWY